MRGRSVPFTIGKQKIASSEPDESDSEFVLVENSFAFLEVSSTSGFQVGVGLSFLNHDDNPSSATRSSN